jgi:hypothetical protein
MSPGASHLRKVHKKTEAEETKTRREEQVQQPKPKKQGEHQKQRCIYYH